MKKSALIFIILLSFIATTIILTPSLFSSGKFSVTGLVYKNVKSRPVSSVWVILSQQDRVKGRALTGDDGKYYIGRLEKGEYKITVKRDREKILFEGQIMLPENKNYDIKLD